MAYAVVRTDAMKCTKAGNIKSGRYVIGSTETVIENGNIVKLSGLLDASANREIYKCEAPGAITATNLYLVATPEVIYDETLKSSGALSNFRNAAGDNITLLEVEVGDVFSISDEAITPIDDADDVPAVGSYVEVNSTGTKWLETASLTSTVVFYGKIIARELYKKDTYLNVIEMISVR